MIVLMLYQTVPSPIHNDRSSNSVSSGPSNPVSSACAGNQICRPFTVCSSQVKL